MFRGLSLCGPLWHFLGNGYKNCPFWFWVQIKKEHNIKTRKKTCKTFPGESNNHHLRSLSDKQHYKPFSTRPDGYLPLVAYWQHKQTPVYILDPFQASGDPRLGQTDNSFQL